LVLIGYSSQQARAFCGYLGVGQALAPRRGRKSGPF